jgi:hypothetical protein
VANTGYGIRFKVCYLCHDSICLLQSLNGLFEERVRQMRSLGNDRRQGHDIRDEKSVVHYSRLFLYFIVVFSLRTSELLQSIISRNDAVLNSMKNRSDQKKEREVGLACLDYIK